MSLCRFYLVNGKNVAMKTSSSVITKMIADIILALCHGTDVSVSEWLGGLVECGEEGSGLLMAISSRLP